MADDLTTQFRNPEGDDGRTVLSGMNEHHAPLWEHCLSLMPESSEGPVLDIGCGGGGFISRLAARYPGASITGVDISRDALEMTAEVNEKVMSEGRLTLLEASVEELPFGDGSFRIVTAMETYFFWPDLARGLAEAARVLAPGGVLAVGCEISRSVVDAARVDELCERYGMTIVADEEMLGLMGSLGVDAEARLADPGVAYIGVKRRRR